MQSGKPILAAGLAALCCVAGSNAVADQAFLKISDIQGESQDSKHKDEIDVLSWSWGVSNTSSSLPGGGGGAGKATFENLSFSTYVSRASPKLYQMAANGRHSMQAVLTVRSESINNVFGSEYLKVTLNDLLVNIADTGWAMGTNGRVLDKFELSYTRIKVEYAMRNPDGSTGAITVFCWDKKSNAQC